MFNRPCKIAFLLVLIALVLLLPVLPSNAGSDDVGSSRPQGRIVETLISVDDPNFGQYDATTGNGAVARITYREPGYRELTSLSTANSPSPPEDYFFRYTTDVPLIDTSAHWFLYLRHTLRNTGNVTIENARIDGWNTFAIDEGGNEFNTPRALWRLYKYETNCPTSIQVGETVYGFTTYQIHNIPSLRTTFSLSFLASEYTLDSWAGRDAWTTGRDALRFTGSNYILPKLTLTRFKPSYIVVNPPEDIDCQFSVMNGFESSTLKLSIWWKFAQTPTWDINLWPSAHPGLTGSEEVSLEPQATWTKRLYTVFPSDKDDHSVYTDFGVLIVSDKNAPPLLGEIWEFLYGANSYLGLTGASTRLVASGDNVSAEVSVSLVPYVSQASMDVLPYEWSLRISVCDSDHNRLVYGPISKPVDSLIRKGDQLRVAYEIPIKDLRRDGKYLVQMDTYRESESTDRMNYARVTIPLPVSLPDLQVKSGDISLDQPLQPGVGNNIAVTVRNLGMADANDASVVIFVDGQPLRTEMVTINAKSETAISFQWTPTKETHKVSVVVQPDNPALDLDKTNNSAERVFSSGTQNASSQYTLMTLGLSIVAIVIVALVLWLWRLRALRRGRAKK